MLKAQGEHARHDLCGGQKRVGRTDALLALQDPNVAHFFDRKYEARGKTVGDLVDYMSKNGLRFAPAVPGDEAAYRALQTFLAAYDDGLTRLAAR